jgi:hypothetical protein
VYIKNYKTLMVLNELFLDIIGGSQRGKCVSAYTESDYYQAHDKCVRWGWICYVYGCMIRLIGGVLRDANATQY